MPFVLVSDYGSSGSCCAMWDSNALTEHRIDTVNEYMSRGRLRI